MKKFLLSLFITSLIVACNDNNNDSRQSDELDRRADSLNVPAPDSTNMSYPADSTRPDPSFPR